MMKTNVQLIRALIQEIRRASPPDRKIQNDTMVRYILEQARAHRETSENVQRDSHPLHW
ncbi:uncharacterized protein LOC143216124 isoform X4 [Lasioglossum baleicum]|uniref:uncharacterized protein LOC143216124 isoform X4 n=1 Tax=Lasioglossum baleicum TaxID=434251 RepID=UPI003FCE7FA9